MRNLWFKFARAPGIPHTLFNDGTNEDKTNEMNDEN